MRNHIICAFYVWLLLLNVIFMRLSPVVVDCLSFCFIIFFLCKHHKVLNHFSVNGHFEFGIIINSAALSILIHIFGEHICIYVGYMPRRGITWLFGLGLFSFNRLLRVF